MADNAQIDKAARAICEVWGYLWDGDPDNDDQVAPDVTGPYDDRPDKALYRKAALAAIVAALDKVEG